MILENERFRLEVSLKAAEMHSLMDKRTNKEWLWQGDPNFWAGRNPILFPIVGSTHDKLLHIDGKAYPIGNHGFLRHAMFDLIEQDDEHITLGFTSNAETLVQYPYAFNFEVEYRMHMQGIDIVYRIENRDEKVMPFNFGLHPAFSTTHNGVDGSIDIEFPCREDNLPKEILVNGDQPLLKFTDAYFETMPTLVLDQVNSPFVRLKDAGESILVSVMGYRWLAFWKKPNARFICIEPWYGHDDFIPFEGDFKDREGTQFLDPNRSFTTMYQILPEGKEGARNV